MAYTLEQCWHAVPGGTAVAALGMARALVERPEVELVGVAAWHRRPPPAPFVPPVPVRSLPLPRRAALRGLAPPRLATGRAGDRSGRRRPRHHDPRPAPEGVAARRDRARPGLPPRSRVLHPPRRPRLHRGARPHPRARRPGAVLVASDAGRRRRRRARPREAPARPVGPRPGRATAGRGRGRRAAPARPRRSPVPAVRRHPRAPQEPGPPAGGLPLARPRPADGRGRAGGVGRRGSARRASDGWGSSTRRRRPRSTRAPTRSATPACARGSACPSSRRWPTARRS